MSSTEEPIRRAGEIEHHYGDRVHVLDDIVALTQLARLCSPKTEQPQFNHLIVTLYRRLLQAVVATEFPRRHERIPTRMASTYETAVLDHPVVDPETPVVCVDIARAGILPSQVCFDELNALMNPSRVRQDHLIVSRSTDADDRVVGASISGEKIGGPIDDRIVLFPDPMGATGSSLATAIGYYKETFGGNAHALITLNLIVTPEFVRRITSTHPEVSIYALRVDRGASTREVLSTTPGARWDEESGLTDNHYIVPGGGGFGELMNNAWI